MPSRCLSCIVAISALGLSWSGAALASSPAAWEEFRRDVEASCREASASQVVDPQIVVDPFGLESYGLAFLTGNSPQDGTPQSLVCIYDKVARTVEIGGALALESAVTSLRPEFAGSVAQSPDASFPQAAGENASTGLPASVSERLISPSTLASTELAAIRDSDSPSLVAPFGGRCDRPCLATLDMLEESDRSELLALPAQIDRTVAANAAASLGTRTAAVRGAAEAAATLAEGGSAEIAPPDGDFVGAASCTLYYFGLSGEAARTVGTHQCRFSQEEGGEWVVEKTSGERLRAEIRPLVGDLSAFVGRTFEAGAALQAYDAANPQDPASAELGNTVGFVAQADDQLLLISSQRRRFESSDSFFWVLAMNRP